jgi:hypothetical protein
MSETGETVAEAEAGGKGAALQIGFAILLIYFNGWIFTSVGALSSATTTSGFYIEDYAGALSLFVRVGEAWYGIARSNASALLFDAPFINAACLVAGVLLIVNGLKGLVASADSLASAVKTDEGAPK